MYWPQRKLPFSVHATSTASTFLFTEHLTSSPVNPGFDFLKSITYPPNELLLTDWSLRGFILMETFFLKPTIQCKLLLYLSEWLKSSRVRYRWFPMGCVIVIGNYWFIVHTCHNCEETLFSLSSFTFLVTLYNVLCTLSGFIFCRYIVCFYMFIVNLYVVLLNTF